MTKLERPIAINFATRDAIANRYFHFQLLTVFRPTIKNQNIYRINDEDVASRNPC